MTWVADSRGLYAIVDAERIGAERTATFVEAVLAGGCAALQLRAKAIADDEWLRAARALKKLCAKASVPFILNDRADLARLCDADGLHLGQSDLPIEAARKVVGSMPIGVSTHNVSQARDAEARGADLIGFGPIFATASKKQPDPTVGLESLRQTASSVKVPVVAIGGIDLDRTDAVARAGARWVAVISALSDAKDPTAAARALHARANTTE
jgi:thiamine-phosphate pyrophosphorylase